MQTVTAVKKAIIAVSAAVALCAPAAAQDRIVQVAPVMATDIGVERVFFGRVVARQTVDFAFQVGGQIVELPVAEGAPIAAGDLIARLDLEPFELSLAQRRAELDQASRNFERFERLRGSTVSQVNVDDAATAAELAGIAVRDAERSLRLATLTAPFDGIVASRQVPNFTTVAAGTPVARIHDMSDLRVEIEVPELLFQQAGANPDVVLTAQFPASDRTYTLDFREVTAEATPVGQTFTLTLGMAPPDDLFVLPGSSVTVRASLRDTGARFVIPGTAVLLGNDGSTHVMVFSPAGAESGTVALTPVTLGATEFGLVEVLDGLSEGAEIVVSGASLLEDGENVRRFAGFGQ